MHQISLPTIQRWLTAWSLTRELPLPIPYRSGFKLNVGYPTQKARYVFTEANDDFIELADTITEPWVFLKVCAPPADVAPLLPKRWVLQPQGYMMILSHSMQAQDAQLSDGYTLSFEEYGATYLVKIMEPNGEVASIGRVVLVDGLAVYDRIVTSPGHQRKGLARFLMKELEKIALAKGATDHFLVATEEGKLLYQSIGWELSRLYTSFVIPASPVTQY